MTTKISDTSKSTKLNLKIYIMIDYIKRMLANIIKIFV